MESISNILITIVVAVFMFSGGSYGYGFLTRKIPNSAGLFHVMPYSILLFTALGFICSGGLFALAKVYNFMAASE